MSSSLAIVSIAWSKDMSYSWACAECKTRTDANEEEGNQDCSGATILSNGLVSFSLTPSEPLRIGMMEIMTYNFNGHATWLR